MIDRSKKKMIDMMIILSEPNDICLHAVIIDKLFRIQMSNIFPLKHVRDGKVINDI